MIFDVYHSSVVFPVMGIIPKVPAVSSSYSCKDKVLLLLLYVPLSVLVAFLFVNNPQSIHFLC